jgi:acetyl esterase/lipase
MHDPEIAALREKLAQRVRPTDIAERRKSFDAFASTYRTPPDIVVEPITVNGVPAEWTTAPDVDHSRAVLYLHGGGYVIGSLDSHRHLAAEVGRTAGARCLALHYRLAPEYPFPAAVDDALAGYRYLCSTPASRPATSPSLVTARAAALWSLLCWLSATPACRSRLRVGASRHGSTWRPSVPA